MGKGQDAKLSLDEGLDAQRHMWALVFATLDIRLPNGRDVGPGHIICWHRRQKLESPNQGV